MLTLKCMWLHDNVKSPGGTKWVIMSHCFLNYSNFKSTAGKETKNNIIGIWCCALSWTFFYPRTELGLSQVVQWHEFLSEHALLFLRNAAKQLIRLSHFSERYDTALQMKLLKQRSCYRTLLQTPRSTINHPETTTNYPYNHIDDGHFHPKCPWRCSFLFSRLGGTPLLFWGI